MWVQPVAGQTPASDGGKQIDWPDTPAGQWLKAYVGAYNEPGEEPLRRFVKTHFSEAELTETPVAEMVRQYFQPRSMGLEKLDVHSVSAEGDFIAAIVAPAQPYGWLEFRLELAADPPHSVIQLRIGPTAAPGADIKTAQDYLAWEDLEDLLGQVRSDSGAPGVAAAVVQGGRIVDQAAAGLRRADRPGAVKIDDRFHFGSLTKAFTATMIGVLVERDLLRWDAKIGETLDGIPMNDGFRPVTLEQLLQHRGGVPSMPPATELAARASESGARSPSDRREAAAGRVLAQDQTTPGEYAYSNAGYLVAGLMAERAAGQPWEALMRSFVFEPLGLRTMGFGWPATPNAPDQPLGHTGTPPNLEVHDPNESSSIDLIQIGPAGDLHGSIGDLARFAAFHLAGLRGQDGALRAETIRHLHTPAEGEHYMGGWVVRESDGSHGHEGTAGTFFAEMTLYPADDLAIVAAANCGPFVAPFFEKMKEAVRRRMRGETDLRTAPATVDWPDTIAARRAKAFVDAMNAEQDDALRRFVAENFSPAALEKKSAEDRALMFQTIRAQIGSLRIRSVKADGDLRVVVVGKCEPVGIGLQLTITMKDEPPHYWAGVEALPLPSVP
jgi:CubicO group peptidase (beta-lactamase class C family)